MTDSKDSGNFFKTELSLEGGGCHRYNLHFNELVHYIQISLSLNMSFSWHLKTMVRHGGWYNHTM